MVKEEEPKEYQLRTIGDLLGIPEDRFDDFMVDLKEWHRIGRSTADMLSIIAEATGTKPPAHKVHMKWIDDGKHDKKIVISALNEKDQG